MRLPLHLDVALTHLGGRKRQTAVSVVGVALGVGFFIAMVALMRGFQQYFVDTVIDVAPHIVISDTFRTPPRQPVERAFPDGALSLRGVKPRDERRGIRNGPALIDTLSRLPGMAVAPTLEGRIILRYGGSERAALAVGIDPERQRRVTRIEEDMVAGSLTALRTRSDGVLLGVGLARELGAELGDGVIAASAAGLARRLTVVGLFGTGITAIDDSQIYMPLKQVQVLLDRPNIINRIEIRLDDVDGAREAARRIEGRVAYKTVSWQEANENIFAVFTIQNAIMYSTVGAIMIVAAFGIFNIVSTVVHEKSRDIAILKSLGFAEADIRRIFLIEGVIVGAIGAVIGWAVGYGLVRILASIRFEFGDTIQNDRFHLYLSVVPYLAGGVFAMVSAGVAAWLPARKAAGLNPVEIVRGAA